MWTAPRKSEAEKMRTKTECVPEGQVGRVTRGADSVTSKGSGKMVVLGHLGVYLARFD